MVCLDAEVVGKDEGGKEEGRIRGKEKGEIGSAKGKVAGIADGLFTTPFKGRRGVVERVMLTFRRTGGGAGGRVNVVVRVVGVEISTIVVLDLRSKGVSVKCTKVVIKLIQSEIG